MTDEEVILDLVGRLERLSIPYMIVGSFASTAWGRPRTTHDTDVVLAADAAAARSLRAALEPDYFLREQGLRDAVERRTMVNAIHQQPVWKFDLIFLADDPFQRRQFERRMVVPFKGSTVRVASPEDTILSKLLWSRKSESERQFRDALEVYEMQEATLDRAYLREWADRIGVGALLARIEARC